jgi:hypothetical protein
VTFAFAGRGVDVEASRVAAATGGRGTSDGAPGRVDAADAVAPLALAGRAVVGSGGGVPLPVTGLGNDGLAVLSPLPAATRGAGDAAAG